MTNTPEQAIEEVKAAKNLYDLHAALCAVEKALAQQEQEWKDSDHDDEGGSWWLNNHNYDTGTYLRQNGIDICELPTFGGKEPQSTIEVWSWDKNFLLVGTGSFREWEIIDRKIRP